MKTRAAKLPISYVALGGWLLALGLTLVVALDLLAGRETYQRDLQTYFYAGRAYAAGLDPYNLDALRQASGVWDLHPFVYPPYTLPLLGIFSSIDLGDLLAISLGAKALAFLALLVIWTRSFVRYGGLGFVAFSLLAFNAAVYLDFRVGNIAIYEQVLLWAGLIWWRKRPALFALLVFIAALFKVTPILFLGLLVLGNADRRWRVLASYGAVFIALHALTWAAAPGLYEGFLHSAASLDERGLVNPSSLAILRDMVDVVGAFASPAARTAIAYGLWAAFGSALFFFSAKAARRYRRLPSERRDREMLVLYLLVYSLLMPRLKTYSYVLLIVPAYLVLRDLAPILARLGIPSPWREKVAVAAGLLLSSPFLFSGGSPLAASGILAYSPLVVAFLLWAVHMHNRVALPEVAAAKPGERGTSGAGARSLPSSLYGRDYYLEVCGGYEEFLRGTVAQRLQQAFSIGRLVPGLRVLDLGCGRGELAAMCADAGCEVWAVDYSHEALQLARTRIDGMVHLARMNATEIAFPDSSFDRVFLIDIIEHLYPEELRIVMREVGRVVRPDGLVVAHTAPNAWLIRPIYMIAGLLLGWGRHPYHVNEQSIRSLARGLASLHGRAEIEITKVPGFFRLGVGPRARTASLTARLARAFDSIFDSRLVESLVTSTPLKVFFGTDLWAIVSEPGSRAGELT
jgi:2-polyprenyl-3-methyl-5-hydroxy-6-metoxy-1,4-benzoquinol methylase